MENHTSTADFLGRENLNPIEQLYGLTHQLIANVVNFSYDEWWLDGPRELRITKAETNDDDAYDQVMEQEKRRDDEYFTKI